ncbi:hypothetical protein HWV62_15209 [Athelia sp. TMB]|nr:hypothetical protein HWV62_15209 [Athelia sp. TMB]
MHIQVVVVVPQRRRTGIHKDLHSQLGGCVIEAFLPADEVLNRSNRHRRRDPVRVYAPNGKVRAVEPAPRRDGAVFVEQSVIDYAIALDPGSPFGGVGEGVQYMGAMDDAGSPALLAFAMESASWMGEVSGMRLGCWTLAVSKSEEALERMDLDAGRVLVREAERALIVTICSETGITPGTKVILVVPWAPSMPLGDHRRRPRSQKNGQWGGQPEATNTMRSGLTEPPASTKILISTRDWESAEALVQRGRRFKLTRRVGVMASSEEQIASAIQQHERSGEPLILENMHKHPNWLGDAFHVDWLRENGEQETRRLYGKDTHCPSRWAQWLEDGAVIPACLTPGSSNNLLNSVPKEDHVETLMCYLSVGDTFTPAHKDLCASSGQNLMCYSEQGGSSFWFMTDSSSAAAAARYFHKLKQELDLETHVISLDELANAPFTVYIAEQKLGDMILVPPRSCHQIVNRGGITIQTSWSRMTLDGLIAAYYHELPIYRSHTTRARVLLMVDKSLLVQRLQQVIELFDDVILEEYSYDHKHMPRVLTGAAGGPICRRSGCFECILSLGVHSSEAVLVHRSDDTHENWHNRHKDSDIFYKSLPEVEEAEKRGTRCDLFSKLVVTARRFATCMPSEPEHTKSGWYDKSRYIANSLFPSQDNELISIFFPPLSPLSDLSSLSEIDEPSSDVSMGDDRQQSLGEKGNSSVHPTMEAPGSSSSLLASIQDNKNLARTIIFCDEAKSSELLTDPSSAKPPEPFDLTESSVAIKVLKVYMDDPTKKKKVEKRLRRELLIWWRLDHKNVLPLYGIASGFGLYPGFVCPWLENGSVNKYLAKQGNNLSLYDRLKLVILCEVATGLTYLHGEGVVHGDLTGANILVDDDGSACLCDFGMSSIAAEFQGTSYITSTIGGNIRWAAPEYVLQANDESVAAAGVSKQTDAYSYGSVMLEVCILSMRENMEH